MGSFTHPKNRDYGDRTALTSTSPTRLLIGKNGSASHRKNLVRRYAPRWIRRGHSLPLYAGQPEQRQSRNVS
jgi:hypothetical protein